MQHHLAARDRSLAAAYAQIEEAAERFAASERARTEAEETAAELEEIRHLLEVERGHKEHVEESANALRAELEEARREPEPVLATEHVVFVRTGARYALVAADGPPPQPGTRLALDERDYLVLKVGPSPFAGDDRPCAFAEPA